MKSYSVPELVVGGCFIRMDLTVSQNFNVCMYVCVFLPEVTYEAKRKFLCCLVEILQFDGQNFYGSQDKNSVKTHTK